MPSSVQAPTLAQLGAEFSINFSFHAHTTQPLSNSWNSGKVNSSDKQASKQATLRISYEKVNWLTEEKTA